MNTSRRAQLVRVTKAIPRLGTGAPSGRAVHMNPEEALEAFQMLGADHMVPMHYGTFPLGGEPIHEPAERLITASRGLQLTDRVHVLSEGKPAIF
jgi:L-ascorbate metabolism protein UlaG (beta-lactamase superfamily)